ncbi:hypothetical protein [Sphingomonas swuensis]
MSLLLASLLAVVQADSVSLSPSWATIGRNPALRRSKETVEIGTIAGTRPGGIRYWMRRTYTERGTTSVGWTTTADCPGSRELIGTMEQITAGPDVPGQGRESPWLILDGVGYSLDAPGRIGDGGTRFRITSNVRTPLAAWIDRLLAALQPCWKPEAPGNTRFVPPLDEAGRR